VLLFLRNAFARTPSAFKPMEFQFRPTPEPSNPGDTTAFRRVESQFQPASCGFRLNEDTIGFSRMEFQFQPIRRGDQKLG
jgi:hypothetical protein